MTKIMVFQRSSLNTKEEILHFFKSIGLWNEEMYWYIYFCLDISMFSVPENSVPSALQELCWCPSEHKICFCQKQGLLTLNNKCLEENYKKLFDVSIDKVVLRK